MSNVNMVYRIEVLKKDGWKARTTLPASSNNAALKQYGLRGSRPYNGQAKSNSGRLFRAVNTGVVAGSEGKADTARRKRDNKAAKPAKQTAKK